MASNTIAKNIDTNTMFPSDICELISSYATEWTLRNTIPESKLDWEQLSCNPMAIHLLEKNLDKVRWDWLSGNPNAIPILEKNLDKINWYWLSENPSAIHILEKNLDKIDWNELSQNPGIFVQNTDILVPYLMDVCW